MKLRLREREKGETQKNNHVVFTLVCFWENKNRFLFADKVAEHQCINMSIAYTGWNLLKRITWNYHFWWMTECEHRHQKEVTEWRCIICSLQLYSTYATCLMMLNNVWMTLAHIIPIHFTSSMRRLLLLLFFIIHAISSSSTLVFPNTLSFILSFRISENRDKRKNTSERRGKKMQM